MFGFGLGTASVAGATTPTPVRAFGIVMSVNGSTADGACGTAGQAGTFVLVGRNTSQTTITVTSKTVFWDRWVTPASFANVCVDETVGATGIVSGGTFTASQVRIWSPKPAPTGSVFGLVSSVNGSTVDGACGTLNGSGTFTVLGHDLTTRTVDVTAGSTSYFSPVVTNPSFANVCVDEMVGATGPVSNGIISADAVMIWSLVPTDLGAFGIVTSVNGSHADNACGVAKMPGSFVVAHRNHTQTVVAVTATTVFKDPAIANPTFANVCVGEAVSAHGTVTNNVLNATTVRIWSPRVSPPATAYGLVLSVNGSTASTACGAGTTGSFTILRRNASLAVVNVNPATKYRENGVSAPTFANVCVNEVVGAIGTQTTTGLNANKVRIWSTPATP